MTRDLLMSLCKLKVIICVCAFVCRLSPEPIISFAGLFTVCAVVWGNNYVRTYFRTFWSVLPMYHDYT